MWEYAVVESVSPEKYAEVCQKFQVDGWSLEQSCHYRIAPTSNKSLGGPRAESRWDLVFKRASNDISYSQMLINRYSTKLTKVKDDLRVACADNSAAQTIANGIEQFLFEGSPEDM